MKDRIIIFLILTTLLGCRQTVVSEDKTQQVDTTVKSTVIIDMNKVVETIMIDLNSDNQIDTITLTTNSSANDQGEFQKIDLTFFGGNEKTFVTPDGWVKIYKDFTLKNKNSVKSDNIFIYKNKSRTALLLFGPKSGAGYNTLTAISIKDDVVRKVFDEALEYPMEISDFDNDNNIDFLGRNMYELYQQVDSLKADIGTYSPYLIYSIEDTCVINSKLTKNYNEVHYIWGGQEYSEKIKILYPRDGSKPQILK